MIAALVLGCGSENDAPIPDTLPTGCAPGEWQREDGVCIPAGLPPDMPCPPGEWQRDGACIPAGVPSDGCGEGFMHDGDRGCEPILPREPCAPGFMAVPGETSCREVSPCAPGTWGDIPVESNTEHVDASYPGMDSDGHPLRPWTTIQAAVDDAAAGAIIAVAQGTYLEDVTVSGKSVRLWGVCPERVALVGTVAALGVHGGADGTEVRSLAIRGDIGVSLTGSLDVLLERVWVDDTASRGVDVENDTGPTSLVLRASLLEQSREFGVFVLGADVTVDASVVRDTQPNAQGLFGRGLNVITDARGTPATLSLEGSVVERSHDFAVFVFGSDVTVNASVIRDTRSDAQGLFGRGVNLQMDPMAVAPSTLVLQRSLVEQSREFGLYVAGSNATVEASVIRDTQASAPGLFGRGAHVERDAITGAPSTVLLRTSLLEQNRDFGVFARGSGMTMEASVVRDTQPDMRGLFGRGLGVQPDPSTATPSTLVLRTSLLERNHDLGLFVEGSDATVETSIVRATALDGQGRFGRGVNVRASSTTGRPSTLVLRASLIEQNHEAGVFVAGASASIESCIVRDTMANAMNLFGDGLMVLSDELASARATLIATHVDRSVRAGLVAYGAHAAIGGSTLICQAFDFDSELYRGSDAELDDLGGNLCGCPEPTQSCKAVTANLQPPEPASAP
ncbi:MAG TPA: hypothetical protein VFB62_16055 [Polyangiaceae bacterium]|nr:hypothetical protein [Polyangiaceae bacterium]